MNTAMKRAGRKPRTDFSAATRGPGRFHAAVKGSECARVIARRVGHARADGGNPADSGRWLPPPVTRAPGRAGGAADEVGERDIEKRASRNRAAVSAQAAGKTLLADREYPEEHGVRATVRGEVQSAVPRVGRLRERAPGAHVTVP